MALTPEGTPYVESSDLVANYPAASLSLANRVDLVGILPFATSTARGTAIPSPTDGQYSYLQDTNSTQFWNGSAWQTAGTTPGSSLMIPTSIANAGGTATLTGGAVTFSGVTSVSLNGCFSVNYESYQIIMSTTGTGATIRTRMRLRASGTDNTSTEYDHQILDVVDASISASRVVDSTRFDISAMNSTSATLVSMVLTKPFVAAKTQGVTQNVFAPATLVYFGIEHTLSNSYDGFSVLVDSGTFAGSIRVYGLQNS